MGNPKNGFSMRVDISEDVNLKVTSDSACLRYAGCEHFVSALGPSALGWGKVI